MPSVAEESHFPLLVAMLFAVGFATVMLLLSNFLGPRRPTAVKQTPFECGNPVEAPLADRFHVKYYLVALLFLAFDVEAAFVYPWALSFARGAREHAPGWSSALTMLGFAAPLVVGLAYVWQKGALSWNKDTE